jgi:hypothetical protein
VVLVAAFLVFGVVVAIAAVIVVREAGRMTKEPPPVLFSMDEAYDFVVERLPDIVAATLTPGDVRRILAFQWEYFQQTGVSANGSKHHPTAGVMSQGAVVGGSDEVDYILRRCAETGEDYLPEQVEAVVQTQLEYLRAIGAMSTPADLVGDDPFDSTFDPPAVDEN